MGYTKPMKGEGKPKFGVIYFGLKAEASDKDREGMRKALDYLRSIKVYATVYTKSSPDVARADLKHKAFFNGYKNADNDPDMQIMEDDGGAKQQAAPQKKSAGWGGQKKTAPVSSDDDIPTFG